MIKGIVFDKDGTLLEFDSFWIPVAKNAIEIVLKSRNCYSEAMAEKMLASIGAYDGIRGLLCYGSYAEMCQRLNEVMAETSDGCIPFADEEITEAFSKSVSCGELVAACEDIADFMKGLKDNNIKTAVITTDNYDITRYSLEKLGIYEYMDKLYTDDGINPTKPHPYYMNCFLNDFDLKKDEVLMIGDTLTDIRFAKNSGVRAISVAKTAKDKEVLLSENDTVLYDISHIYEVKDIEF